MSRAVIKSTVKHPDWSTRSVIYQISVRHFTPEGTFRALMDHLPRLKELGVDILYFMPLQPIGVQNRKGSLGSPYSISDYYGVNPEFGTDEDLKELIRAAHGMGFRVIMDWVANHTSPDSVLYSSHPEWFSRDEADSPVSTSWWNWEDTIELDYGNMGLRDYMTDALLYWVREYDLDGFRCDVAGAVPTEFWNNARKKLEALKPVLMLAEWEQRDLHVHAFDLSYAWSWYDSLKLISKGLAEPGILNEYYGSLEKTWPEGSLKTVFLSNHDKNAWEGTEYEVFGEAVTAGLILAMISEGIPMLFNGQEAAYNRRLPFFEKDHINWKEDPAGDLIRKLINLRKTHPAMANRPVGTGFFQVVTDNPGQIFAGKRELRGDGSGAVSETVSKTGHAVMIFCNLSPREAAFEILSELCCDRWEDWISGAAGIKLKKGERLKLGPWDFRIFVI